ncbi:unnamed protein product, partial [Polarella glacialis]
AHYMCNCRLTRNFFVRSLGEHFEYDGDDVTFARQYEKVIAASESAEAAHPSVDE